MARGDEKVVELIAVSFVENLVPEQDETARLICQRFPLGLYRELKLNIPHSLNLWRSEDITIVYPEESIRDHPEMYFHGGRFSAEEVSSQIVSEALLFGVIRIHVERVEAWWLIRADSDWLPPPLDATLSSG